MIPADGSTPPGRARLLRKSMTLLGWELIQKSLAGQASSPVTESRCLSLVPETEWEPARQALEETAEMFSLLQSAEPFPLRTFVDIRDLLKNAAESLLISPPEGLAVLNLLRLTRSLRRVLEKKTQCPRLQEKGRRLDPLPALLKELEQCISDEGEIKEDATPELKRAVREVGNAKQKLESQVAKLLSSAAFKDAVQDAYYTEREERYVIPIRAEYRSRVEGIVHDSSGSGQTLFMEPSQIVPLNNQLKISRLQVEQEKMKILGSLAREMVTWKTVLLGNLETLSDLDLIHARAQVARAMRATKCPANTEGRVKLKQARNPELILNEQNVVPNDILWDASVRVIIISGPNTGGKTVTLKTLGLMALMVRAGLFLPVEEDSEIPFFPEVYADIGDEQNIQLNLSTFSAHLEKIIHTLSEAGPGSLILLDELGIATDPLEGAALAEAILMKLKRKGVTTLVSTHYLSLKMLAQTQEGFLNACTEFDTRTLSPTYRLIFGVPGQSAALDTAERLGLPPDIIRDARERYQAKDSQSDQLLQKLTQQRLELEHRQHALDEKTREIERLAEEQKTLTARLREEEQEFRKSKSKRLQAWVKEGKNEIYRMIQEIKGTKDLGKLRRVEKKIHAMGKVPLSDAIKDMAAWDVPPEKLKAGDPVLVQTYGAAGTLLEDPADKKQVRVQLGNLTTTVELKTLRGRSQVPPGKKPRREAPKVTVHAETTAKPETECNLRGMRLEEARAKLEAFISQAIVNKVPRVRVVHGHGMGTLKHMVRDYLQTAGVCKDFHPGSREEGGDGVTVIDF